MATPITPKNGYAFKHKETGKACLMLFIGTGDRIENYDEITEEEYNEITEAEYEKIMQEEMLAEETT